MVASTSRLAFTDCFELMEKAIADPKGIRIKFASKEDAWLFRLRLHSGRRIDRIENRDTYPEGHKMHGKSVYDGLIMRIKLVNGSYWLQLERLDAKEFEIESLSEPLEHELPLTQPEAVAVPPTVTIQSVPKSKRRM